MNKFITKIFKSAGVNAKVSKDSENPRFRVVENKLTLEGTVKPNRYTMKITDNTGKTLDNLSVVVSNSNDIVNRINESITTLKMLSSAYDNTKLVEEDEEFDVVDVDEEVAETLEDGLANVYQDILDVADKAENLVDLTDSEDAEQLSDLISIASSLYACAIDVDEFIEDIKEEEEDMTEGVHRLTKSSKGSIDKAISNITMAESLLRNTPCMKNIVLALKDIKSELIVR